MSHAVPDELTSLVQRWDAARRPAQSAIDWPRTAWTAAIPAHAGLMKALPERIDRELVRTLAHTAAGGDGQAMTAFVAAMVWGYGRTGYGPWRTCRVLEQNPAVVTHLRRAAEIQASAGAVESYRYLANEGRMRYLGPAFATKFLHFVPQCDGGPPALILDAVVSRAIAAMTGVRLRSTVWRTTTYERYLDLVAGWSDVLGVEPETVEMLLFVSQSPGQWTEPWLRDT